ncbi:MAG TPA: hypothetical protein VKB80_13440 [Kofleriaceae bacterium]|nr:hypothetical protein [Kofleriaceae bacterium]
MRTERLGVLVPLAPALALAACAATGGAPARTVATIERDYPALRWVPAGASYVLAAGRVDQGVRAARELADLAAIAGGATADELDRWLRGELGASPLDEADLAGAGIDLHASAALFAQAGFPTAALPVADAGRLRGFLARHRPAGDAAASTRRGEAATSWSIGDWRLSWAMHGRWLFVHLGPRGEGEGWLDRVVAAPDAGLAADPDLAAAADRGRRALGDRATRPPRAPGLVGLVRAAALARDLAGWSGAPDGLAGCARRASAAAPLLSWAADFSRGRGAVWAAIDLAPAAARALRAHIAPPPPPGYRAYRAAAAVAVDWSLELDWLERVRARLACPLLDQPIRDPVREATGFRGPRAWHVAATSIDPGDLSGAGAAHVILADPGLIAAQLESIPGRSLFERSRRIAGQRVQVLSVPGLPTIAYRQAGEAFTLAVGDGVMEEVLAPAAPAPRDGEAGLEVARVAIAPPRLPALGAIVDAALSALAGPPPRPSGRIIAARLSRYDEAALSARLDGNSVAISATMRLARTGRFLPTRLRRTSLW